MSEMLLPWDRQPQEAVGLRRELQRFLSASIIAGQPVFGGCGPVTTAGGILRQPTAQGLSWVGDATDNIAFATPVIDGSLVVGTNVEFTLVCVFRKIGAAIDSTHIAGYGSSSGSSGNTLFRIIGGVGAATAIRVQVVTSTAVNLYNTDSSAAAINNGEFHCAVVTIPITGGTDTLRYYIDGKSAGSVARTVGVASTTFDRVSVGGTVRVAAVSFGGYEVAAFVALRGVLMPEAWCLKASRLSSVWDSLFEPRRIIVPTQSAAVPTISALSARLITSTSAQPRISYS